MHIQHGLVTLVQNVCLCQITLRQRVLAIAHIVHRLLDILPEMIDRRQAGIRQTDRTRAQHDRNAQTPRYRSAGDVVPAVRHAQTQLTNNDQRERQRIKFLVEQRKQQPEHADECHQPVPLAADRIPRHQIDEHRQQQCKRPHIPLGGRAGEQRETAFVHRIPSVKHGVEPRATACEIPAEPCHEQHGRNGHKRQHLCRRCAFGRPVRHCAAQCAEYGRRKHGREGRRMTVPQPMHGQQRTAEQQSRHQRHPAADQIWICPFGGTIPPNHSLLHCLLL